VNIGRIARRLAGAIVHNWPLKLAAIGLATFLYAGFVASQDSNVFPGPVPITPVNAPQDAVIVNQLPDVERVQYIAPADLGRLRAEDFRATVDLSGLPADGTSSRVRVDVRPVDPRVTILAIQPPSVTVILDQKVTKPVQVTVVQSTPPEGIQVGQTVVTPSTVDVSGPSSAVNRVVEARVTVTIDASALNVDRDVSPEAVDDSGATVAGVELEPATVNVKIPVYKNLQNKTVPVNPIVTGTPAAGFRVDRVMVNPLVVTVEGDQSQLVGLLAADTAPVSVSGATSDVTSTVAYALPTGMSVVGAANSASVTVKIVPITETRTYVAGIALDGQKADLEYSVSDHTVLLTIFGSTADLDRLSSSPIVIRLNVEALGPGSHEVPVVPVFTSAVTVAAISPPQVTVTVTEKPTPTPPPASPAPSGDAAPSATPTPAP
jgi:YbbR domain-containing protein